MRNCSKGIKRILLAGGRTGVGGTKGVMRYELGTGTADLEEGDGLIGLLEGRIGILRYLRFRNYRTT